MDLYQILVMEESSPAVMSFSKYSNILTNQVMIMQEAIPVEACCCASLLFWSLSFLVVS